MPGVEHRQHKGLNNRAENRAPAHQVREKVMRRFTVSGACTTSSQPLGLFVALPTTQAPAGGRALPRIDEVEACYMG